MEDKRLGGFKPRRDPIPAQILHIWFWIATLIFVYMLVWYILNAVAQAFMLTMVATFPDYYNTDVVTFFQNLWTYSPDIVILGGVLMGVYAEIQRKKAERFLLG